MATVATEYFPTNIGQPRFDWASTVQVNGNLLTNTEDFNATSWVKTNFTVTSDTTIAPDGTLTADTITGTGNAYQLSPANTTGIFSIYVNGGTPALGVTNDTTKRITFNTSNQTFSNIGANVLDYNYTTEANGFYRVWVKIDVNVNRLGITDYNGGIIWGAQFELNDSITTYKAVGAQLPTTTPLAANPTSNGLLIEEARTNRILWCRDATQTQWVKTNVTAAKDQTGVDGVANAASSLTATANDGTCIQTITLASGSRTGSVYLKRITGTGNVQVTLDGTTYSTVDLSASEWRRIVLSGTVTNPTVGIKLAVSGDAVAMDYGQVEDGLFATTPILTTAATATRAVDVVTVGGVNFNNWFNLSKGTIFSTFNILGQGGQGNPFLFVTNVTGRFDYRTSNAITFTTSGNASVSTGLGYNAINKIAFSYNSNVIQTNSVNGGASAIVQLFNAQQLQIDVTINNFQLFRGLSGYLFRFTFVPTAATAKGVETLSSKSL